MYMSLVDNSTMIGILEMKSGASVDPGVLLVNLESTLKRKSQSIAYHFVREGVARDEWRATYINTHGNEADLLTGVG